MHIFDYSFLSSEKYMANANLTQIIYDLRARKELRAGSNTRLFEVLHQSAIIDTVRSSNAIEGIVTTRERIEEMIDGRAQPSGHDEREILGYSRALDEIYASGNQAAPDISEKYIKHLHMLLLRETDSREAGKYKSRENWIQERGETGHISVRFMPVKAADVSKSMDQLIAAYMRARQDAATNRLLLVACFIVDFLCIHPFMDGNGRVSRLLTALLLAEAGFDIGKYISLDKKIDEYKFNYYESLKQSSEGWHDNANDYNHFIRFILQILYRCYKELDDKFIEGSIKSLPKSRQIEAALKASYVPISKRELIDRFPDISVRTIEKVLGDMVREGAIEKIGSFKDARYRSGK